MSSPEYIINEINKITKQSNILKEKTYQCEKLITELQKKLYSICQHEWEIDRSNVGEHTEYICRKCNLDKDEYYYLR